MVCLVTLAGPGYTQLVRYSFNFLDGPTSRVETLDAFGTVRGAFNYLDSEGNIKVQNYDYMAQVGSPPVNFIESAQAPEAVTLQPAKPAPELTHEVSEATPDTPEPTQEAAESVHEVPETPQDISEVAHEAPESIPSIPDATPSIPEPPTEPPIPETTESPQEVTEAPLRIDFGQRLRAFHARFPRIQSRGASRVSRNKRSVVVPSAFPYVAPHRFNPYSAPLIYSHPAVSYSAALPAVSTYSGIPPATYAAAPAAVRDAILLRVVHNPAHTISYRVD